MIDQNRSKILKEIMRCHCLLNALEANSKRPIREKKKEIENELKLC